NLVHVRHEGGEAPLLFEQYLTSTSGETVVGPASWIARRPGARGFAHEPVIHQTRQMAVERGRLHRHLTARLFTNGLHDRVAIIVAVGQRQQRVKSNGLQHTSGSYMFISDMSRHTYNASRRRSRAAQLRMIPSARGATIRLR